MYYRKSRSRREISFCGLDGAHCYSELLSAVVLLLPAFSFIRGKPEQTPITPPAMDPGLPTKYAGHCAVYGGRGQIAETGLPSPCMTIARLA